MAENTRINKNKTVGDLIATDEIVDDNGNIVKHQRVKVQFGPDGSATDVTATDPLPARLNATTHPGAVVPITSNREGSLDVHHGTSISAFGDHISVAPQPKIQLIFPYSIDTAAVFKFTDGTGTILSENSQISLRTGTGPFSVAFITSHDFLIYKAGFGATCRFSFGVTTDVDTTNTAQQAGLGTAEDGFVFQYEDNEMQIVRRQGGSQHQWELTITTGASSAGNITITLNDTVFTVAVTDSSGSGNFTAAEIASDPQFLPNFFVTADGNAITFQSSRTGPRTGTFSFDPGATGTTAAGIETVLGVTETNFKTPSSQWNVDKCDGTGPQMPLIDWSKGNVFQIRYQWLGYGAQSYFIENPNTGNMVLVHRVPYSNRNVVPSIFNPSLQFLFFVNNGNTNVDLTAFIGSAAGMIDGGSQELTGNRHAAFFSGTAPNGNFGNIVSFCAPLVFKGKTNRTECSIVRLSITASAAANIEIVKNPTLGGTATWTSIGPDIVLVSDQDSTSVTGGELAWAERAEKQDRFAIEPEPSGFKEIVTIFPGDVVTVAAQADSGTSNITIAINWIEPV
jgi:hypothetical protein